MAGHAAEDAAENDADNAKQFLDVETLAELNT